MDLKKNDVQLCLKVIKRTIVIDLNYLLIPFQAFYLVLCSFFIYLSKYVINLFLKKRQTVHFRFIVKTTETENELFGLKKAKLARLGVFSEVHLVSTDSHIATFTLVLGVDLNIQQKGMK